MRDGTQHPADKARPAVSPHDNEVGGLCLGLVDDLLSRVPVQQAHVDAAARERGPLEEPLGLEATLLVQRVSHPPQRLRREMTVRDRREGRVDQIDLGVRGASDRDYPGPCRSGSRREVGRIADPPDLPAGLVPECGLDGEDGAGA